LIVIKLIPEMLKAHQTLQNVSYIGFIKVYTPK